MVIDVNEIPDEGLAIDRVVRLEDEGAARGPLVPRGARVACRATPGARGVEFDGRVEARASLECSRCLETFDWPVAAEFFLVVVSEALEVDDVEKRLAAGDTEVFHADRGKVDLRDLAREQIHLNLPLKPVCRGDCAGLCPACGGNRNRIKCACRPVGVDPRLAPLRALKQRMEGTQNRAERTRDASPGNKHGKSET